MDLRKSPGTKRDKFLSTHSSQARKPLIADVDLEAESKDKTVYRVVRSEDVQDCYGDSDPDKEQDDGEEDEEEKEELESQSDDEDDSTGMFIVCL